MIMVDSNTGGWNTLKRLLGTVSDGHEDFESMAEQHEIRMHRH